MREKKGVYGLTYQEVWLMDNLTIEAKAIYGMLCSYAGSGSTAYPSVEFMCKKLHISNTRFYKHMNLLIGAGVVEKNQIKKNKGSFENNVYTLVPNLRNIQNAYTQNEGMQNEYTQNEGANINNNKINSKKNNNNKGEVHFTPPTIAEVEQYCREKGYNINASNFVDFYEAKGWMIGKNKMKDWKAAVRTWVRRENNSNREKEEVNATDEHRGPASDFYKRYIT